MSELEANHPKCMGAGIYTYEFTTFAITVAIAVAITVAIAAAIETELIPVLAMGGLGCSRNGASQIRITRPAARVDGESSTFPGFSKKKKFSRRGFWMGVRGFPGGRGGWFGDEPSRSGRVAWGLT